MSEEKKEDNAKKLDYRLGQILFQMNKISASQLEKAIEIKKLKRSKLFGQILIEEGFCSLADLRLALEKQQFETRIGQVLYRMNKVTTQQVEKALNIQKETGALLGFIFVQEGFCSTEDVINALKTQKRDNRLGSLLLREGYISEEQLEIALIEQEKENVLLGEMLIRLDFITTQDLADVLILQGKILYQMPSQD